MWPQATEASPKGLGGSFECHFDCVGFPDALDAQKSRLLRQHANEFPIRLALLRVPKPGAECRARMRRRTGTGWHQIWGRNPHTEQPDCHTRRLSLSISPARDNVLGRVIGRARGEGDKFCCYFGKLPPFL